MVRRKMRLNLFESLNDKIILSLACERKIDRFEKKCQFKMECCMLVTIYFMLTLNSITFTF